MFPFPTRMKLINTLIRMKGMLSFLGTMNIVQPESAPHKWVPGNIPFLLILGLFLRTKSLFAVFLNSLKDSFGEGLNGNLWDSKLDKAVLGPLERWISPLAVSF
ncbi:MAG: hypothetical protein K2X66_05755 [Cyanobacteria bacterium]|nr:hypothetical protein [Cyanobacteriota bacterium]